MQLAVGDKVVYPRHGIGQVTAIENQELVEGFGDYYVIKIPDKRMTVRIPVNKIDELGVRPLMAPAKLDRVMDTLSGIPGRLPEDIKKRQARLREKMGTGYPLDIAEAVRDLTWRKESAHLTKADSELLAWGQELLTGEVALVTNTEITDARKTIDAALTAAISGKPEVDLL